MNELSIFENGSVWNATSGFQHRQTRQILDGLEAAGFKPPGALLFGVIAALSLPTVSEGP